MHMTSNRLLTIARYSILEASRDRFLILIVAGMAILFLFSIFIGELAITESVEMKTAILAFLLRLFSVFTVSLFVITSMLREFQDKGFELVLSHSLPRSAYLFGKFSGYAAISFMVSCLAAALLFIHSHIPVTAIWALSLFFELLIIVVLSQLSLFTLNSMTFSFSLVIAFYLLCRNIAAIQLISNSPIVASSSIHHRMIDSLIDGLAYIIPDLYQFTKTDWLLYGMETHSELFSVFLQTIIYVVLLSSAALFDLYRKEL